MLQVVCPTADQLLEHFVFQYFLSSFRSWWCIAGMLDIAHNSSSGLPEASLSVQVYSLSFLFILEANQFSGVADLLCPGVVSAIASSWIRVDDVWDAHFASILVDGIQRYVVVVSNAIEPLNITHGTRCLQYSFTNILHSFLSLSVLVLNLLNFTCLLPG